MIGKEELINKLSHLGFPEKVVDAFKMVKRENFIPEHLAHEAYRDRALPIGLNQTISQPYTIAIMLTELDVREGQKVLEVGSGCGYVLALLSHLVGEKGNINGIEILPELAKKSTENLAQYDNIEVFNKNGADGLPEKEPFDRIIISAACKEIPHKLAEQLANNGIIVAPIGSKDHQSIKKIRKVEDKLQIENDIPGFVFVPFISSENS